MTLPTICLYQVGDAGDELRARQGSFVSWFEPLFREHQVRVELFDGRTGALPPDITRFDGIVTTGSPASLTRPEPWMEAAVELVRQVHAAQLPLLGVCFVHQLIGAAFGGSVIANPAGWQVSTHAFELTARGQNDPLFDGITGPFEVNLSHRDVVQRDTLSRLNGIDILAYNDKAPVGAVAAGPHIRGVQFHPEVSGAIARTIVDVRREQLIADAGARDAPADHPDRLLENTRDAPQGERVLHNFLRHFVGARKR